MTTIESVEEMGEMGETELEELYTWIDTIPLSRQKRNMVRDFSDGVLVAEVIRHMFPKLVEMHNYTPACSTDQKMRNWNLLNTKVFKKLRFELSQDVMRQIVKSKPGVIERVLFMLRTRLERVKWDAETQPGHKMSQNERPEVDQHSFGGVSSRKGISAAGSQGRVAFDASMKHKSAKFPQDDTVPLIILEEKEQEVLAKDETIQILQAKIKRLEHLLHLKDIRIEDLQGRLESLRVTGKR